MYKQTELAYKNIALGFGSGSIYDYGCNLVSVCNGLQQKGYSYTPEQLNDILKVKGLFTGDSKNLLDSPNFPAKWADIFTKFQRLDNWGSTPTLDEILKPDIIAVGLVDAAGVGGTAKGTHFVLITGKMANGHAKIYDPWRGIEEDIAVHWGTLGYILGLRLYTVKPHVDAPPAPAPQPVVITDQTKIPQIVDDNGNPMEVQAIRSKLNDQSSQITALKSKILSAKNILS